MPDCIACGYETVIPENIEVIEIVDEYVQFMFDGFGSPNLIAIREVLEIEGLSDRIDLLKKIMLYVLFGLIARNKNQGPIRTISSKSKTL